MIKKKKNVETYIEESIFKTFGWFIQQIKGLEKSSLNWLE